MILTIDKSTDLKIKKVKKIPHLSGFVFIGELDKYEGDLHMCNVWIASSIPTKDGVRAMSLVTGELDLIDNDAEVYEIELEVVAKLKR